jgi:cystathionine beta-lyase/cystathionine gamma-synthase
MLSFEIKGGVAAANRFMSVATLPTIAPSLGGIETLITRPAARSDASLSSQERAALGISDSLVRVSVGLENTEDLIADFDAALNT